MTLKAASLKADTIHPLPVAWVTDEPRAGVSFDYRRTAEWTTLPLDHARCKFDSDGHCLQEHLLVVKALSY